jgi:hypothetical protein
MGEMKRSIRVEKRASRMHQMLGFLLRSEANRTDNRLIHRSTSEQILAADADKFGSKPQGMYLLQKAIRTQYIYLEAITQTLAEGIAQFIMHPRLSAGGHNCDFPFVSVCSVEAKIAVLVVREGISGTRKQRFFRSCEIRAHDFASLLLSKVDQLTDS